MHLILLTLAAAAAATATSTPPPECLHDPDAHCRDRPENYTCGYLTETMEAALCCNLGSFKFKEQISVLQKNPNLTRLYIQGTVLDELNINMFWSSSLESLSFTEGHVPRVVRPNKTILSNLKCLNLSSNQITNFESRVTADLQALVLLDLSNNNLTNFSLAEAEGGGQTVFWLDISKNKEMWCSNVSSITTRKHGTWKVDFLNKNNTNCTLQRNYWFQILGQLTFYQLEQLDKVNDQCTPCTCNITRYQFLGEESLYMDLRVNCTGKNLTSLPDVPAHTVILDISNNNITSLKRLKTDANYSKIVELYAENNQIVSLQEIEASAFLKHFMVLDLRRNKLTEIETYIYNNAFDGGEKSLKLAGNEVFCDCNTALHVKMWLLKNRKYIRDYGDIRCGNFNNEVSVKDLDQNKVCKHQRVWTDYINYIIACEVALLLLLITKVSYDYWVFRTAGYLPWPASKMPKMPCDWVFEN